MNTQKWFVDKESKISRTGKVEMISNFQWNRHFQKVSEKKTFTHGQKKKKKKKKTSDVAATLRLYSV